MPQKRYRRKQYESESESSESEDIESTEEEWETEDLKNLLKKNLKKNRGILEEESEEFSKKNPKILLIHLMYHQKKIKMRKFPVKISKKSYQKCFLLNTWMKK